MTILQFIVYFQSEFLGFEKNDSCESSTVTTFKAQSQRVDFKYQNIYVSFNLSLESVYVLN